MINRLAYWKELLIATGLAICLSTSPLHASDAIKASVDAATGPTPIITVNGTGYTPGTYAVGTIQLFYTVAATSFPTGTFATFELHLQNTSGYRSGSNTVYPVLLNLVQTGSNELNLTPTVSTFTVTSSGWSDSTLVTISIPAGVSNADGTDLVGNLQLETNPRGSHLDTVTTVQVHVKLVYPTSCLRVYDIITDEQLNSFTPPLIIQTNHKGSLVATNPGQLSDNIIVVNTCASPATFDLGIDLGPDFSLHPNGNPGNAVFTYVSSITSVPTASTVVIYTDGTQTPRGELLCLANLTLPSNETLLATAHMAINKAIPTASLVPSPFAFSASIHVANTACGGALNSVANPNPAGTSLAYLLE